MPCPLKPHQGISLKLIKIFICNRNGGAETVVHRHGTQRVVDTVSDECVRKFCLTKAFLMLWWKKDTFLPLF